MNTDGLYEDLQPGKHLLLDENVIADRYKLRRTVHQPRREPCDPIMLPDEPWEDQRIEPTFCYFDEAVERYRMWYRVHNSVIGKQRKELGKSKYGNIGAPQPTFTCYAESEDGISWVKPMLGVYDDHDGNNNIVFKGFSEASGGILNLPDSDLHKRFLFTNCEWFDNAYGKGGITYAHSDDGINWDYLHDNPVVIPGDSDTINCTIYDATRDRYVVYMRAWHSATVIRNEDWVAGPGYMPNHQRNVRRKVGAAVSADLRNWSEPQNIIIPDELETNDYYGLMVFECGGYFLGQILVYDDDAWETIHIELVYSRDGIRWQRLPQRVPFIPTGEAGQPDGYMVFPIQQPVEVDDQLVHYWTGLDRPHDGIESRSTMYRGVLRADGYVSLDASRQQGALLLRPFTLQSDSIFINAATQNGRIEYELVEPWEFEPQGKVIDGFTFADCDAFDGDETNFALSFRGSSDLSALKGKRLMLRMRMYHSQLYSVTI